MVYVAWCRKQHCKLDLANLLSRAAMKLGIIKLKKLDKTSVKALCQH